MNGFGLSGVAPKATIVEVKAGQDSGYFFLAPTMKALTYAGDAGLDVVNMSFYVDPWLYNCKGGAPEDSASQANDQDVIIATVNRALNYAHRKGVTLVSATGNENTDMANPGADSTSPDYPADAAYDRARSTTTTASTSRPRGRTSWVSTRSARPARSPTSPTTRPSRAPARWSCRLPVAGSVTGSARRRTAPTRTRSCRRTR